MSKRSPFAFGQTPFIAFLAFLSAFVPLSIDLYLPALPIMSQQLEASPDLVNLTLSCFMLLFALSMLIWGPLSDKYGRRPILFAGLGLYIAASLGCALAGNIWQLIVGRSLQAVGSGALGAVTMAIVKDVFRGRVMENVLTAIQTMTILAPMLAPVLGGVLLTFTSWRGIFWILTICGAAGFACCFALRETLRHPTEGPALHTLTRIPYVLKNRGFRSLLIVFSIFSMPFMAYLAASAYIYQSIFGFSAQMYSAFFAANAVFSMLGPLLYVRILRELPRSAFLGGCFIATAVAGLLLIFFGHTSPYVFAGLYFIVTFTGSANRPPATVLMMSQLGSDNGTVASLMGACALLCGSLAMLLCSLPWPSFIVATGVICLVIGTAAAIGWFWCDRNKVFKG
ncbi:MAG: multidrug effflux MFS transporter [Desulfovibrionaceae bacterium]|nr:multidrug effflux MFS transporter [Desulfovibrionaceae bacterium]